MTSNSAIFLCNLSDIEEGACKSFDMADHSLFAIKKLGQIYLYYNRCPHAGLPLNWFPDKFLDRDGELIQCTSHGALFQINSGRCVAGPCPGRSLKTAAFEIHNNQILFTP